MTKKIDNGIGKGDILLALQEILQKNTVSTQEEIRKALQKKGFIVNQTKISRLFHKLGVVKMIENDVAVYRLQLDRAVITPSDSLKFMIVSIKHNGSLIVIRTTAGSAQFIAAFLDHKTDVEMLGTIAGDDTIFIAPEKTQKIQSVFNQIYKLLLG
jgi:transcriptional regulator of arginine metabolism